MGGSAIHLAGKAWLLLGSPSTSWQRQRAAGVSSQHGDWLSRASNPRDHPGRHNALYDLTSERMLSLPLYSVGFMANPDRMRERNTQGHEDQALGLLETMRVATILGIFSN